MSNAEPIQEPEENELQRPAPETLDVHIGRNWTQSVYRNPNPGIEMPIWAAKPAFAGCMRTRAGGFGSPERGFIPVRKSFCTPSQAQWQDFVVKLVEARMVSWEEIASVVLGELNPPQVGTTLASNKNIQARYPPKKIWQAVKKWFYDQPLGCRECKTLLKLEAEHIIPKEEVGVEADSLENLQLLCKRCNAKKRPSHKNAGLTHLTAEAGLMWLLLHFRPDTYTEFKVLCRAYGMTMADVRFQEAWALAEWLRREGRYP